MLTTDSTDRPAAGQAAVPLMELRGICKSFPGVNALTDVSFQIRRGRIHMLLGENGAGKSTLMKVLSGVYAADAGEMRHNGRPVAIRSPADARRLGIALIAQEFSLVPHLSVARNIFLGREPAGALPLTIDRRAIDRQAAGVLERIGFDIDPHTPLHALGVAQQQMVEIAKALSQNARILVMDEPTSALSDRETVRLVAMIRQLQADGVAIVYISHRMAEVFELGDEITVLRDGRVVGHALPSEVGVAELVTMMAGRKVETTYRHAFCAVPGEVALSVRGLSAPSGLSDIALEVRTGEIVGLCGLVGSGRSEVAHAIFGADPIDRGEIRIFGQPMQGGPERAAALGAGLIPESRKSQGLALLRTVEDNLVVSALGRLFPRGVHRPRRARAVATRLIEKLRIAGATPKRPVHVLSGGNQQKVVIGKWLAAEAKLFLLDEPTRGIDVRAKAEIFTLVDRLVRDGAAVLMISSEQSEIVQVCDRAYVMREGRIVGHLSRGELSEENILRLGMHHD